MKVGFHIQVSESLLEDREVLSNILREQSTSEIHRLIKRKSIKVNTWRMQMGRISDDFIRSMVTFVFTGKAYKIPRIIKNRLLK